MRQASPMSSPRPSFLSPSDQQSPRPDGVDLVLVSDHRAVRGPVHVKRRRSGPLTERGPVAPCQTPGGCIRRISLPPICKDFRSAVRLASLRLTCLTADTALGWCYQRPPRPVPSFRHILPAAIQVWRRHLLSGTEAVGLHPYSHVLECPWFVPPVGCHDILRPPQIGTSVGRFGTFA